MQTSGDNNKVVSQILETNLVPQAVEIISLYFDSTVINDHIEYYRTTNRENFLQIQNQH